MSDWSVIYEKAIRPDGSLFFPERLTHDFLDRARKTMGSYQFANQYLNEVIPDDEKQFKAHWIKYYKSLPDIKYSFGFIDPAIGQNAHNDYTGIAIVDVDPDGFWYLRLARRERLTPTQICEKMFDLHAQFNLQCLGVETQAYQEALLYILDQEMRKRKLILPVKGIKRTAISKQTRILGLVPRFEWGRIFLSQGMSDFEDEYGSFPRGTHDDILDSLASLEEIVFYPERKDKKVDKPHSPSDPNYERWYIQSAIHKHNHQQESEFD